jgi:hypothetical protein
LRACQWGPVVFCAIRRAYGPLRSNDVKGLRVAITDKDKMGKSFQRGNTIVKKCGREQLIQTPAAPAPRLLITIKGPSAACFALCASLRTALSPCATHRRVRGGVPRVIIMRQDMPPRHQTRSPECLEGGVSWVSPVSQEMGASSKEARANERKSGQPKRA